MNAKCPKFEKRSWIEISKRHCSQNCEVVINKLKHQVDIKSTKQDNNVSTGLKYGNRKITEVYFSMMTTK